MCGGIEVAYIELAKLGASNAGGVEDFENGAITQPEEIGGIGLCEEDFDFLRAQGFGQCACLLAREVEIGGGVRGNEVLAAKCCEKAPDAAEPGDLGVDA